MHGSERLVALAARTIDADPRLRAEVAIRSYTCFGRCDDGPNMFVQRLAADDDPDLDPDLDVLEQQRGFYPGLDEAKIVRIVELHCGRDEVVADLVDDY
jgi:(2Fe-2S) ferredoxin